VIGGTPIRVKGNSAIRSGIGFELQIRSPSDFSGIRQWGETPWRVRL
jgi:hypothetical protein